MVVLLLLREGLVVVVVVMVMAEEGDERREMCPRGIAPCVKRTDGKCEAARAQPVALSAGAIVFGNYARLI